MRSVLPLVLVTLTSACGGSTVVDGSGTTGSGGAGGAATTSGTGGSGAGTSSSTGGGDCALEPPVGRICVRGEPSGQGEELTAETPVTIQLYPEGCFSSSCTVVKEASCELLSQSGDAIVVDGTFCLEDTTMMGGGCTADCNGGGFASCEIGTLPEGGYSVSYEMLSVLFTIPMTLPFGGECAGSPF